VVVELPVPEPAVLVDPVLDDPVLDDDVLDDELVSLLVLEELLDPVLLELLEPEPRLSVL
jgi:hypothetical protein